jgi:hypothetical protein
MSPSETIADCQARPGDIAACLASYDCYAPDGDPKRVLAVLGFEPEVALQDQGLVRYALHLEGDRLELFRQIFESLGKIPPRTLFLEFYVERHNAISSRLDSDRPELADRLDNARLGPERVERKAGGMIPEASA